jgi:hypothetical protein
MFSSDHLHRRVKQTPSLFDFLNGLVAYSRGWIHTDTQKALYIQGKVMSIVNPVPAPNTNQSGQREGRLSAERLLLYVMNIRAFLLLFLHAKYMPDENSTADRIRVHLRSAYIDPARARHESTIRIVAGEVLKALHLQNRAPAVCQVLRGRKFLAENDLILEKQEGPPSGLSTTTTFIYRLASHDQTSGDREKSAWDSLRGIAKKTFAALGGGEAFLKSEREKFYDPGRDPLDNDWGKQ